MRAGAVEVAQRVRKFQVGRAKPLPARSVTLGEIFHLVYVVWAASSFCGVTVTFLVSAA